MLFRSGISLGVRQAFLEKFVASVSGGYDFLDYRSVISGVAATRQDSVYTVRVGLDMNITMKWQAGVFFTHRTNEHSGQGEFAFEGNQVGLHTSYSF